MSAIALDRSDEQRLEALRIATEIRSRRAQLKRDIKARRKRVADVLVDPPEFALSMKVYDLLTAAPGIGRGKAATIQKIAGASLSKTLGGLSDRQRSEIARIMRERAYRTTRPGAPKHGQNLRALDLANAHRLDRADIKAQIASGRRTVPSVLQARLHATESMRLAELLKTQHRWGDARTARFLKHVGISDAKTVGALTDRQRAVISEELMYA